MHETMKIKVLITKIGLDGHDRGAKVISSLLREAGMEVVYLGVFQTTEDIVNAAVEEDVDVIGLSCLSGEHLTFTPEMINQMRKKELGDVLLLVGGVIPREDIPMLKEMGVAEVFTAGSMTGDIIGYIKSHVRKRYSALSPQV